MSTSATTTCQQLANRQTAAPLTSQLTERYQAAQNDQLLLELREEIALIDVRLIDLLTVEDWEQIYEVIEQRRRLVVSENRRLVEAGQMLSVEQAMLMIAALTDIINTHVTDRKLLAAITADVSKLID